MADPLWLPSYLSSGMVLQQQVPFHLHGKYRPAAEISLVLERSTFDGRPVSPLDPQYGVQSSQSATCDADGRFEFELPAFGASFDPFTLTLNCGKKTVQFQDVLFGEVWVCGGQSNMQIPLGAVQSADQVANLANLYYVRVLQQSASGLASHSARYSYQPAADLCLARWLRGDQPDQMAMTTAVGFSFARELHLDLKIPVGLIETALRGSQIHAWLSRKTIEKYPNIKKHVQEAGFYRDEADWNMTGSQEWSQNQPAALFNSKIAPLGGLGARGILWYHGEGDYQYPDYYQQALLALVRDWQTVFRPASSQGLGFLYVQLAPHFYGHRRFEQLAEFNEMLSAVRHIMPCPAALVAIHDLPPAYAGLPAEWRSPIHPAAKLQIGQRLKTVALGLFYQRKAPLSAPECSDLEVVGNKMMISFTNIGDGLRLTGDDSRLRGFAICGPDRIFVEAQAKILYGLRVLVWYDQISEPCAVSYAYADMNQAANLISKDQLAVIPFRSDRDKSRYFPPMEWTHCESLSIWGCPSYSRPEETGWQPAWQIERGQGDLRVEKANKNEGDGSLFLRYVTDDRQEIGLEPILQYDSQFPPLDLSIYAQLSIDVFNTDQQVKSMRLALATGLPDADLQLLPTRVTILPALRWQRLQYDLNGIDPAQRAEVRRLAFIVEDRKGKGVLYLDQIRLIRP